MVIEIARPYVQQLLSEGAQLVDVLEAREFADSHLPGARSIPLPKLADEAPRLLDPAKPTVVYCYDSLCDLSPRGAHRLESLGFGEVYDYSASKVDWLGAGLPFEGARAQEPHLATLADPTAPTCTLDDRVEDVRCGLAGYPFSVVVDGDGVVLGIASSDSLANANGRVGAVMEEAPKTFRPHLSADEAVETLDKSPRPWLLVTNLDGTLVGIADSNRVRAAARGHRSSAA